jgi:hypothetical protein
VAQSGALERRASPKPSSTTSGAALPFQRHRGSARAVGPVQIRQGRKGGGGGEELGVGGGDEARVRRDRDQLAPVLRGDDEAEAHARPGGLQPRLDLPLERLRRTRRLRGDGERNAEGEGE